MSYTLAYIFLLNYVRHAKKYWLEAVCEANVVVISDLFCGSGYVIPQYEYNNYYSKEDHLLYFYRKATYYISIGRSLTLFL